MSNKKYLSVISVLLLCFGLGGSNAFGADLTAGYQSGTVIMGDAGLCIDVIESPAQQGLVYCHDDVSGMYRRGPSDTIWVKLNVAGRVPTNLGIDGADGTPGIGCSYQDANKVYMAWAGHFFRSTNKGDTWLAENSISPAITYMAGNGTYRMAERMTVDPLNDSVVYYGSQKNGLYRSIDGGKNWSKSTSVPEGDTANGGVVRIICDRKGGQSGNPARCTKVYAAVKTSGLYESVDGGNTFSVIAGGPGPVGYTDIDIDTLQNLWVSAGHWTVSLAFYGKRTSSGDWTRFTPENNHNGYEFITIAPNGTVLFNDMDCRWWTTNQGQSWIEWHYFDNGAALKDTAIVNDVPWAHVLCWVNLNFSPFSSSKLWCAHGYGVSYTIEPFRTDSLKWVNWGKGIENKCVYGLCATPEGKLLVSGGDVMGLTWNTNNLSTVPSTFWASAFPIKGNKTHTGLAYCQDYPHFVVTSGYVTAGGTGNTSALSNNGGNSFHVFPTQPPERLDALIAVSKSDTNNIVIFPDIYSSGAKLHYTTDGGKTWLPSNLSLATFWAGWCCVGRYLIADPNIDHKFYAIGYGTNQLWASTDGGANWTMLKDFGQFGVDAPAKIMAIPGKPNHLWYTRGTEFAYGGAGPLRRSTDGGTTWITVDNIAANNIGWGAPAAGAKYPALFAYGNLTTAKDTGLFRSTDEGVSWDKINGKYIANELCSFIRDIDGDKNVFGRVYASFNGIGVRYVQPAQNNSTSDKPQNPRLSSESNVLYSIPESFSIYDCKGRLLYVYRRVDSHSLSTIMNRLCSEERLIHPGIYFMKITMRSGVQDTRVFNVMNKRTWQIRK